MLNNFKVTSGLESHCPWFVEVTERKKSKAELKTRFEEVTFCLFSLQVF